MRNFLLSILFTSLFFSGQAQAPASSGATANASSSASAQTQQTQAASDDTSKSVWPAGFEIVKIPSSADGEIQLAYWHKATRAGRPLIVSLHTWSGDYSQSDPLVDDIVIRDYNYIHPDFRGPNNRPAACGSPLTLSDLQDAIEYAVRETAADPAEVHIIGTSGGGYMTLLAYMKLPYPVKSFSAWAPISDLEAWYWESLGRKQKYADDILKCFSLFPFPDERPENELLAVKAYEVMQNESLLRSPINQDFPAELRKHASLCIYEGIHDGYTGSVPITHSIRMYNRLVEEFYAGQHESALVPERTITDLVTRRLGYHHPFRIGGRRVHLEKGHLSNEGGIKLTIFEGGHEQLDAQALSLIPVCSDSFYSLHSTALTIGDSNGAIAGGWVDQLRALMPYVTFFNNSQSGRTIGFDNGGRAELNALSNVDQYLNNAFDQLDQDPEKSWVPFGYVILCLGTNDTKAEFAAQQDVAAENFDRLLQRVTSHPRVRPSHVIVVSPPPMGIENMAEKYVGGNDRLAVLVPKMEEIAKKYGCIFVDVYHPLQPIFRKYAEDGVHMSPAGQRLVADAISKVMNAYRPGNYTGN